MLDCQEQCNFAQKFKVYGFDTDNNKINILRSGKSYIINVKNSIIKKSIKMKFLFLLLIFH